ncbi:helix-turn-helix domain-containing protein [Cupriavidus sp. RAF12]|uniref:helix-turn-helix domain-containing protein n=1 Tax=Cupriavidus sp. RAF12 TaxID=3233050 RepID=UPI003F8DC928
MAKYDERFKLKVVKEALSGRNAVEVVALRYDVDYSMVRRWIASYQTHGRAGLRKKYTRYSARFKLSLA